MQVLKERNVTQTVYSVQCTVTMSRGCEVNLHDHMSCRKQDLADKRDPTLRQQPVIQLKL